MSHRAAPQLRERRRRTRTSAVRINNGPSCHESKEDPHNHDTTNATPKSLIDNPPTHQQTPSIPSTTTPPHAAKHTPPNAPPHQPKPTHHPPPSQPPKPASQPPHPRPPPPPPSKRAKPASQPTHRRLSPPPPSKRAKPASQ